MDVYVKKIVTLLKKEYTNTKTALNFSNPFEIVAATILSAQCTDARVNIVTKTLFKKYRSIKDYANANPAEFEREIRSTGFYRNKAKNIIGSAKMIIENFGGKVPDTMDNLIMLPGVARKTANVVLNNAFGKADGIAVDTHVRRVTQRLELTRNDDPVKIEQDLLKLVPRKDWLVFPYLIQSLGRSVCKASKPDHPSCVLKHICPSVHI